MYSYFCRCEIAKCNKIGEDFKIDHDLLKSNVLYDRVKYREYTVQM